MDSLFRINSYKPVLALIIFLGVILRFSFLEVSPPSLNWDEAALGYNAFSILKTGKDEFGVKFPLFLRSFDDYKPALYSYLSIPFIYLFGLTQTSTRALSALSGSLLILVCFFFTKKITKSTSISLIASFLLSIEPWSIHFSRAAFEANVALTLLISGVYFLSDTDITKPFIQKIIGALLICLSAYTYHAEKILLIPILLIFVGPQFFKNKKLFFTISSFCLILIAPLVYYSFNGSQGVARLSSTSIVKVLGAHSESGLESILMIVNGIIQRFASYFSPVNLFVRATPEPTQHIPGFGMFYNWEFVLWIIGLYIVLTNYSSYKKLLLLILISTFPAIITWNWFYPARVLPLLFFFTIICAIGLNTVWTKLMQQRWLIRNLCVLIALILISSSILKLSTTLLFFLPQTEQGSWQTEMKKVAKAIPPDYQKYEKIVIETGTAQPHIFVLFYTSFSPSKYQESISKLASSNTNRNNFDFERFVFRSVYWPKDQYLKKTLLIGPPSSLPIDNIKTATNSKIIFQEIDQEGNLGFRAVEMN